MYFKKINKYNKKYKGSQDFTLCPKSQFLRPPVSTYELIQ